MPYYAILRAVPDNFVDAWGLLPVIIDAKTSGVIAMFASILLLCLLPWLVSSKVRSARFRPIYKQLYWIFFADCLLLGWIGGQPAEGTMLLVGRIATFWYFFHLLILIPFVPKWEKTRELPESISAAVTPGGEGMEAAE